MPHVSVIIATYNRETFIARALSSVLSQSFRDFEVIVVDDGSSDGTEQVVRRCGGDNVRYVFQKNAGPGAARNHGVRISTGKYVAFLDSDDMWMPTFLAQTVSALDAHPEADVVTTAMLVGPAGPNAKTTSVRRVSSGTWELSADFTRRQLSSALEGFWVGAVLARKEVISRYGGFYEHGCTLGEDVYLWLQVALNHKAYRVPEALLWYNTGVSSLGFFSKRTRYPLEPLLTDPEPIWRNCPRRYRRFLSYWLACHALKSIHLQIATGDYESARWLLQHYPLVRTWRWDWLRIQFKLAFPNVTKHVRRMKTTLVLMPARISRVVSRP
jgi:glycosyltransferase involved in cell wall biosynthesis